MRLWKAWCSSRSTTLKPAVRRTFAVSVCRNNGPTAAPALQAKSSKTRNIGIIAHIDAGKTTTTERMLYYSGYTRRLGDVDDGSTVTDFLPAERARGITIQSAAISFKWPPKNSGRSSIPGSLLPTAESYDINLIDTPGHADFTFEVIRSLRILDGAVCILDGVAGVEAQTEKVWHQADQYQIPRIIFVNKLDRDGAAFGRTVFEVGLKLRGWPAVCQIPWFTDDGKLIGIADAVHVRALRYQEGGDGKIITVYDLPSLEKEEPKLNTELRKARVALVELLSEHDDSLVEKFLEHDGDHMAITSSDIIRSLRRCIQKSPQLIVPIFAGASFRNIGVQPLLDAVANLLPYPEERPDPDISMGPIHGGLNQLIAGNLTVGAAIGDSRQRAQTDKALLNASKLQACALAFKVVHDAKRGVLVYVRVYSGSLQRSAPVFNTNLQTLERAQRLLKMYADDAVDVPEIAAGEIGVITGLKHARTGDTLLSGTNSKAGPPAPLNTLQLRPITVPPPVFIVNVEPTSLSEEKHLSDSLALLLREDPSLYLSTDPESGQTHLSGMGELHLEIATDRLLKEFKAKGLTGSIEISYREAILGSSASCTETVNREIAGKSTHAACTATVFPLDADNMEAINALDDDAEFSVLEIESNKLTINHSGLKCDGTFASDTTLELPPSLNLPNILSAVRAGVSAALARGPSFKFPLHSAHVELSLDISSQIFPDTTSAGLSAAARLATQSALRSAADKHGGAIMEPVMNVSISVDESSLGAVMHDLSASRGGQVTSLDSEAFESSSPDDAVSVPDATKIYAPPDLFSDSRSVALRGASVAEQHTASRQRQISARIPLKEMVGYLKHLRSLTGGRGTFVMAVDRFERMSGQRQKILLQDLSLKGRGG